MEQGASVIFLLTQAPISKQHERAVSDSISFQKLNLFLILQYSVTPLLGHMIHKRL